MAAGGGPMGLERVGHALRAAPLTPVHAATEFDLAQFYDLLHELEKARAQLDLV